MGDYYRGYEGESVIIEISPVENGSEAVKAAKLLRNMYEGWAGLNDMGVHDRRVDELNSYATFRIVEGDGEGLYNTFKVEQGIHTFIVQDNHSVELRVMVFEKAPDYDEELSRVRKYDLESLEVWDNEGNAIPESGKLLYGELERAWE